MNEYFDEEKEDFLPHESFDWEWTFAKAVGSTAMHKRMARVFGRYFKADESRYDVEHVENIILEALTRWMDDIENMKEGETIEFPFRGNHDAYKMERKFNALYMRQKRNPDQHEQFKFSKAQISGKLFVTRKVND